MTRIAFHNEHLPIDRLNDRAKNTKCWVVADGIYTKRVHIGNVTIICLWSISQHVADPHSPKSDLDRGF